MDKTLVERWVSVVLSRDTSVSYSHGFKDALSDFTAACTPRPPQPEWLGQWDSWWIQTRSGAEHITRDIRVIDDYGFDFLIAPQHRRGYEWSDIAACLPVSRTGYPTPVGWGVVDA